MAKYKFIIKCEVGAQTEQKAQSKLLNMIDDYELDAKVELVK